jgi:hypothetical protein
MPKSETITVSLPLFSKNTTVREALDRAMQISSPAVISTDGTEYWLHRYSDLASAVQTTPTMAIGNIGSKQVPQVDFSKFVHVGGVLPVDLVDLDTLFPNQNVDVAITSIGSDFLGNRVVTTLANPKGMFEVVVKNWVCPVGQERSPTGGMCPKHNVARIPG